MLGKRLGVRACSSGERQMQGAPSGEVKVTFKAMNPESIRGSREENNWGPSPGPRCLQVGR